MGLLSGLTNFLSGGVGSVVSSLISGGASLLGGELQNQSSANSVADQENFQTNMSDTSYQRATADMKAAGLNPMLAYSQGGASTPTGSTFNPTNVLSPAVSSAQAQMGLNQDLKVKETQADLNNASAAKADQDAATGISTKNLNNALIKKANADAANSAASTASTLADLPTKKINSGIESSSYGKALNYINRTLSPIGSLVGSGSSAASAAAGLIK